MDSRQLIKVSELLVRKVEAVEERLHNTPIISPELHEELFRELERAQIELKEIQAQISSINVFTQIQINTLIDGLDERMITLYGRIDNQWVTSEILKLEQEALKLEELVKKSLPKEIKIQEKILQDHVTNICKNHRLLKKDRKVIAFAKDALKKAAGGYIPPRQVPSSPSIEECEKDEVALDLFEIADLFYQHRTKCAQIKLNQLAEFPKRRVQAHLSSSQGNMMQAILTAAFEIADSADINELEINSLFKEADQVRLEELMLSDLSFKSRVSLVG